MPWQIDLLHQELTYDGNLTSTNCSHGVQWIYHILQDCVWEGKGIASEVLGLASLVTWMGVSLPQIIKNFRNTKAIEGLSFMLILLWTLGDSANLIGAKLTRQLPLQIYSAVYYVFVDLLLFSQFLFYSCWWKQKYQGYEHITPIHGSNTVSQVVFCISGTLVLSLHMFIQPLAQVPGIVHVRHPAGRSLMAYTTLHSINIFSTLEDKVGYGIGLLSTVCYTFSRIGQLFKNCTRKSTEGLSMMMFILAVFGNLTYGLSILVRDTDVEYILRHLPWIIGSLGVIFLDLILLAQFRYYGTDKELDTLLKQPLTNPDMEISIPQPANYIGSIN